MTYVCYLGREAFLPQKLIILATCVLAITLLSASSGLAGLNHGPMIKLRNGTSTNWSGYAVETNLSSPQTNAVTDVKSQWVVPTVTAQAINTYSSSWIGIDGYSDGTVEQIGTDQDSRSGAPAYYAWYEMYPKMSKTIRMTINPGDTMSAEVSYTSKNSFTLKLTDVTSGQTFSTVQKANAKRSSAEWVVEAPWSGGVLPLANFGTETFTGAGAIVNGHLGSISDSSRQNDAITMTSNGGAVKAAPSALSPDGMSFTDTWNSN